jgi:hypothetical protein
MLDSYLWDLDLVSLLEVLGKGLNEVLGGDILNGGSYGVDEGEVLLK